MKKLLLLLLTLTLSSLDAAEQAVTQSETDSEWGEFQESAILTGYTQIVNLVSWSRDSNQLASGSRADGTIKIWDSSSAQCLQSLPTGGVKSLDWSPDGSQLVSTYGHNGATIWNLKSAQVLKELSSGEKNFWSSSTRWSPDGSQIASYGTSSLATQRGTVCRGRVLIWDIESSQLIQTLPTHDGVHNGSISWLPNGLLIAGSNDGYNLLDTTSGKCIRTIRGHNTLVSSVCWIPERSQLATGSLDGTVKIWDLDLVKPLKTLNCHEQRSETYSVSPSPDGTQLASGSGSGLRRGTVYVWDLNSAQTLQKLTGHSGSVLSVSWSSDGTKIASGSQDTTIKIWERRINKVPDLPAEESYVTPASAPPQDDLARRDDLEKLRRALEETQRQVTALQAGQQRDAEQKKLDEDGVRPEGAPLPAAQSAGLLAAISQQMKPSLDFLQSLVQQSVDQLGPVTSEQTTFLSNDVQQQLDGWLGSLTEDLELLSIKQLAQQKRDGLKQESLEYKAWNEIVQKISATLISKLS